MPVFISFGLWNVLLLPMAIHELGATDFEYGIQEGVTSLAFVAGALLMARFADRLPAGAWLVFGILGMGMFGVLYGLSPTIYFAIGIVAVTGFLNAPSSVARRTILQRETPREMRGRVFSAFFVSRDVLFLIGMAGAALADLFDVRLLIILASLVLVVGGILHQVVPGLGRPAVDLRHSLQLLRTAPSAPSLAAGRVATMLDFDRLTDVLPELGNLAMPGRSAFLTGATLHRAGAGMAIVKQGDAGDSAFFILNGKAIAGVPQPDGNYRALSSMAAGDFFGEIAALTGSTRTANVVAEGDAELIQVPAATLRSLMNVPAMSTLINGKLDERLTRTANADNIRLARLDQRDLRDLRRRRGRASEVAPVEAAPALGESG
jgi:CRP-like cAMP-binding protein